MKCNIFHIAFVCLTAMIPTAWAGPTEADDSAPTRQPVPTGEALQRMQRLVQEAYRPDEATTPQDKATLAARIQTDLRTATEPESRYVLLQTMRQLACESGQVDLAMSALVVLEREFVVELAGPRLETLTQLGQAAENPLDKQDLCHYIDATIHLAVAAENLELANRCGGLLLSTARSSGDDALTQKAMERVRDLREFQSIAAQARRAAALLENDADNPQAHSAIGRYRALALARWEEALPNLARGVADRIQQAAQNELTFASSGEAVDAVSIADAWYDLAQQERGLSQCNLLGHADTWYHASIERGIDGVERIKVDRRREEIARILTAARFELAPREIVIISAIFGSGRSRGDVTARVQELIADPDRVVEITTPGLGVRNRAGGFREKLVITYRIGTRENVITLLNGEEVNLRQALIDGLSN